MAPPRDKLDLNAIIARLDHCLEVEFSFLHVEQPAAVLAQLPYVEKEYVLSWVERIASTNTQLAYQFITKAIEALDRLDRHIIEAWALHAMDMYDQQGLHPAMAVIKSVDLFIKQSHERAVGSVLDDESGVLTHFAHGLSGRPLKLEQAEHAWTDTETIYLPPLLAQLGDCESNFQLYKSMVAFHWAQARYGSFQIAMDELLSLDDAEAQLYLAFEAERLDTHLKNELPGLYRRMQQLDRQLNGERDPEWQQVSAEIRSIHVNASDSLKLARQYAGKISAPAARCYQGQADFEAIKQCMMQRLEKEKTQLRTALLHIAEDIKPDKDPQSLKFDSRQKPTSSEVQDLHVELTLDDQPMAVPESVKGIMTSIMQDLGELPDDYLQPAGPGEYDPSLFDDDAGTDDVWSGTYHEQGAILYNEWDYRRQHYRKNWCAVREKNITPVYDNFVSDTLIKYRGLLKHLRRSFEAMRDEDRLLKRQPYGDDIDIDALVEAIAESSDGSEMSDSVYTRMHRSERNIAVAFMVDMSGSTKGWINEAERESLILLCETLETLGDRYAIYGFSGMARKRCEIYRIKEFDEDYNNEVRARISGIEAQDYTRMGFAIRHLSQLLKGVEAKTRVLITLSDGKPDDYDGYRGQYGVEDTRRALVEARRDGIHPYCITIDTEARDYLPYMYGDAAYTVIDEVSKLPLKVSDIYRRLTS
ncbi:MAG: VWA domain-containing protein [Proteobacteria bacterium]|nr:VWA domain-containing protein [Pseudomonadota bacterium]